MGLYREEVAWLSRLRSQLFTAVLNGTGLSARTVHREDPDISESSVPAPKPDHLATSPRQKRKSVG